MLCLKECGNKIMENILFLNSEDLVQGDVERISEHLIQITGVEKNLSGFELLTDSGSAFGRFPEFTTLYKEIEGGFILSDDGSVWVEPEPEPEPEPITFEQLKEYKKMEVRGIAENNIASGVELKGDVYSYGISGQVSVRNACENALSSGKDVFLKNTEGDTVMLTANEAVALYTEQEKNRINIDSHTEQVTRMIDDVQTEEELEGICYETELRGDYLTAHTERVRRETVQLLKNISVTAAVNEQAKISAANNTDEQALSVKALYPEWIEIIGQVVKLGFKFVHEEVLYKTKHPDLLIQEQYIPGEGTESLYEVIDEAHAGTLEDPIHYNGNMELVKGKYYVQNEVIYICIRGTEQPVYHALADLAGIYVELVK